MSDEKDEAKKYGELTDTVRFHGSQIREIYDLSERWHNEIRAGMDRFDIRLDDQAKIIRTAMSEFRSDRHNNALEHQHLLNLLERHIEKTPEKKPMNCDIWRYVILICLTIGAGIGSAVGGTDLLTKLLGK